MSGPISDELRAARSRAGKLGAASKWGGQRIVRLDQIDPNAAAVIRSILRAAENAKAVADVETATAPEVTHGGVDSAI